MQRPDGVGRVDRHDVRVLEPRQGPRLARQLGRDLQRHGPVGQVALGRQVDAAERPAAQLVDQAEAEELVAGPRQARDGPRELLGAGGVRVVQVAEQLRRRRDRPRPSGTTRRCRRSPSDPRRNSRYDRAAGSTSDARTTVSPRDRARTPRPNDILTASAASRRYGQSKASIPYRRSYSSSETSSRARRRSRYSSKASSSTASRSAASSGYVGEIVGERPPPSPRLAEPHPGADQLAEHLRSERVAGPRQEVARLGPPVAGPGPLEGLHVPR